MTNSKKQLLALHAKWRSTQPLPAKNSDALWQWLRMHFNYHSNRFEGNQLTYKEVKALLIDGMALGVNSMRDYEEMEGHDEAFAHVRELAAKKHTLGEQDIKQLNLMCMVEPFNRVVRVRYGDDYLVKITPGEYKRKPNYVVTAGGKIREFLPPEKTPKAMAALVKWMNRRLDADEESRRNELIDFLAELHQRFVNIHPFEDGNGRVVRLLLNYVLLRHDFLPLVLDDRDAYMGAIQRADADDRAALEAVFAANIAQMLQLGVSAGERIIGLDESAA